MEQLRMAYESAITTHDRRIARHGAIRLALLLLLLLAGGLVSAASGRADAAVPAAVDAVTKIYWTDQGNNQSGEIWRLNSDGFGTEMVVSGLGNPRGVSLDSAGNRMYWVDRSTDFLGRANLDGTSKNLSFCSGLSNPDDLVLDPGAGMMYWTEPTANQIRRSSMNSCNPQVVVDASDGVSDPVGIALDAVGGKIYWTEFTPGNVKRANTDGSGVQTLINSGLSGPLEMELDVAAGYMYIVDSPLNTPGNGGEILRAPLNGGSLTQIGPQMDNPRGIALDLEAGHIYWIDFGQHALKRMNLNGANVVTLKDSGNSVDDPRSVGLLTGSVTTPCYSLVRQHTGQGADPTATPGNSTGCPAGQYTAGASITVNASPNSGWSVGSWSGTNNNASTSTTNTVTMPANNHTVIVNYVAPTCYTLLRQHTGQGADPTATPGNSTGCPAGQYTAGASITVNASPSTGWALIGWTGTVNDSSTSSVNTVTMPAANHTVIAHYDDTACFFLARQHTGQGNDPIASPPSSTGCNLGWYEEGAIITLTADPAPEWTVQSWGGTTNNSSTGATNTAVMPANNHTVTVNYAPPPCYALTLTHEGQGSNPVASPPNSTGCSAGSFHVGAVVSVSAIPATGWEVLNWSGTLDDASTATGNVTVMPDGPHTILVRYRQSAAAHNYVPIVYSNPTSSPTCHAGDFEIEPNNSLTQARINGSFCLDKLYRGLPTDQWDMFVFDPTAGGQLRVEVANHRGPGVLLQVYDDNNVRLEYDNDASDGLSATVTLSAPQRIFVLLFIKVPNTSETSQYTLEVTLE
jgi:sugar lactone lactonase YvrE